MISFSHPQLEPASDFKIFSFFFALVTVFLMWGLKQNIVSNVTPSSFGVLSNLIDFSLIVTSGCRFASDVAGPCYCCFLR